MAKKGKRSNSKTTSSNGFEVSVTAKPKEPTTTQLKNEEGESEITVVSKNKLKQTPENLAKLREKFKKIEKEKLEKDEAFNKNLNDKMEKQNKANDIRNQRIILITHLNTFLYATCFFIQAGSLPYLTKKLGADPVTFGQLQTVFAIAQLIGGPIYGRIGDLFGERKAIIIAFTASVFTYLLTGLSYSLPILFLSRVPSIFMHVMQGSQMVVTFLSTEENRASALARLGFSYGIGMVAGPAIGGFLTANFNEQTAALVAAAGSTVSLVLVILFFPEIPKQKKEVSAASVLNLKEIFSLLLIPKATSLLVIKAVCGIPIGILQSMFSVIAMEKFGLPADQNGMVLSYIGVLSLLMQGLGIKAVTNRASDVTILKFAAATLTISYYCMSLLRELTDFLLLQIPFVCSLCLFNSIVSSSLTKAVDKDKTGTMLGLNMAVHSVIRTVSPTAGGWMLSAYGFPSIGLLGVGCNAMVLILIKLLKIGSH